MAVVLLTGHYFIYKTALKSHKNEFKSYIRSHYIQAEEFEINPSELFADNTEMKWLDENKEICIGGIMYDIIRIVSCGTKVKLVVVNDKYEKDLMQRYSDEFSNIYQQGNSGKKNNNLLKELLSFKYFQSGPLRIVLHPASFSRDLGSYLKTCFGYLTIYTLPPNV
jgi:hypothetical protein